MPNHCENDLTVRGKSVDLQEFWAPVRLLDHHSLPFPFITTPDFNREGEPIRVPIIEAHYPMPSVLRSFPAGSESDHAYKLVYGTYAQWTEVAGWYQTHKQVPLESREQVIAAAIKIHDEEKAAWPEALGGLGTSHSFLELADTVHECMREYGSVDWYEWALKHWGTKWGDYGHWNGAGSFESKVTKISFESAWSPPREAFDKIAKDFPKLAFTIKYYEQGMGFKGELRWKGGESIYEAHGSYRGYRGG